MTSRYVGLLYLFFVSIIGIIFGTLYIQMLPHATMSDLLEQWGAIFKSSYQHTATWETFQTYIVYHLRFFACMLAIGITIIGYPVTIVIHFFKAFLIGSTLQLYLYIWDNESYMYIIIWILPSTIFIIAALIILSSALARYSYDWYRLIRHESTLSPLYRLSQYSGLSLILIIIAACVHTYLSPLLFSLYINTTG